MKRILKTLLINLNYILLSSLSTQSPESKMLHVEYSQGKPGDCGVACAEMIANYYGGKLSTEWDNYKTSKNYIENIGWKHLGLKRIIEQNSDVKICLFKFKSYLFVIKKLEEGSPVIVSISAPDVQNLNQIKIYSRIDNSKALESHMIVCVGYDKENIIVHDPRNIGIYKDNLKVPKAIFSKIFNGNGIVSMEKQ